MHGGQATGGGAGGGGSLAKDPLEVSQFRVDEQQLIGYIYDRCPKGIGHHNVKMSEEVIDVDELNEGHLISPAAGKQGN